MIIWSLLALVPTFFLGRWCVTMHDAGCAVVLCAAAGGLTAFAFTPMPDTNLWSPILFFLVLGGMLLHTENTPVTTPWRQHWTETIRSIYPSAALLALFCGLCSQLLPLILLSAVLGVLTRLADTTMPQMIAAWLPLVGLTLGGILCAGWIPLGGAALILCSVCLCFACLHLLPMADAFLSTRAVQALFCLFVFLTYYFTNCIL